MVRPSAFAACAVVLVAACGGGGDGGGQEPPVVHATFRVTVPERTPAGSSIYLAADFNAWDPASEAHRLAEVAPLVYERTLDFAPGTEVQLKVTRGSWETVEKGSRGQEVPNRVFTIAADGIYGITVGSWADLGAHTLTGDVTRTTVPGFLGGRGVWIYRPPGYEASADAYPVLYLLDGQNVFDFATSFAGEWEVDETLEALIPAGEVRPMLVVAVENGSGRIAEYTPWADAGFDPPGGEGDATLDAIETVLVPWVEANHRTLTGAANRGFGGASLGGLMAVYAVTSRPDVFGAGMAMSPSIWWADRRLVEHVTALAEKPPVVLWTDMGTAEYAEGVPDLRALRDALVAEGWVLGTDLMAVEDAGAGHDEAAWSSRFPDAVRYLFPPAPGAGAGRPERPPVVRSVPWSRW